MKVTIDIVCGNRDPNVTKVDLDRNIFSINRVLRTGKQISIADRTSLMGTLSLIEALRDQLPE